VTREQLVQWVTRYEQAWRTEGTAMLSDLFAPDATYSPGPYEETRRGLEAIAQLWEAERESPDEVFAMTSEVVAVEGDVGVVRVRVGYGDPPRQEYRDLWIVRIDDDRRCVSFEEWPFWPPGTNGTIAGA
jgi:ketosteroid isomerase-like protein